MYKQIFAAFCCLMFFRPAAWALEISGKSAALYDPMTGVYLYEKQADLQMPMASTTKIMTAAVALGACSDLTEKVLVNRESAEIEGSKMYLQPGEQVTMYELLCGLLLSSGNDAAMAIATHVGGSIDSFADMMNDTANQLKLRNTHFENPSGLDGETHYTTAKELAQIAAFAMENHIFREIVSSRTIKTESGRVLSNHNRLLSMYTYADGIKTGFTKKSGRCLVTSAAKGDRRLIAVTLNAPDDWNDHIRMFEYGFLCYQQKTLAQKGEDLCRVPVAGQGEIALFAGDTVTFELAENEQVTQVIRGRQMVYPPFSSGEVYGEAAWYLNGVEIGKTTLHYGCSTKAPEPVEKNLFEKWWSAIANRLGF